MPGLESLFVLPVHVQCSTDELPSLEVAPRKQGVGAVAMGGQYEPSGQGTQPSARYSPSAHAHTMLPLVPNVVWLLSQGKHSTLSDEASALYVSAGHGRQSKTSGSGL